jgi:hypothetical protein
MPIIIYQTSFSTSNVTTISPPQQPLQYTTKRSFSRTIAPPVEPFPESNSLDPNDRLKQYITQDDSQNHSSLNYTNSYLKQITPWWIEHIKPPEMCFHLEESYPNSSLFNSRLQQVLNFDLQIGENVRFVHGVFSTISNHSDLRRIHRKYLKSYDNVYDHNKRPKGSFLVVFAVCLPRNEEELDLVLQEQKRYNDVVVLPCFEAINCGKTYHWFKYSWERILKDRPSIWAVGKGDMDTFIRFVKVERELTKIMLSEKFYDLYWGHSLGKFMYGMCYFLSRSNVHFIAEFPVFAESRHNMGAEDCVTGFWMHVKEFIIRKDVNYIHDSQLHDWKGVHECSGDTCRDPGPDTLALHRCKTEEQFKQMRKLWPDTIKN